MGLLATAQRILGAAGYHADVTAFLILFGLALTRLVSAISLAPFLGGSSVPGTVKIGFSAVLAAVLYPSLAAPAIPEPITSVLFVALLIKEALIGVTIGFLMQLIFYSVQMAGALIDTQRGMNQVAFVAPQLPGHVSTLGIVKLQASLAIFLLLDGHLLFLRGLNHSFERLPVMTFPKFQAGLTALLDQVVRISADTLLVALQLSAPVMIALFLTDVSFGAIGKMAQQIHVHSESQPVKSMVGLGMLLISIGFIFERLVDFLMRGMARVFEVVEAFR